MTTLPLDPAGPPPNITPRDTPSNPAGYAQVTPRGTGPAPAPYDIQAPQDDLAAMTSAAGAISGAGVVYPRGPRQMATETLMQSPQGFAVGGYDIQQGFAGGGGDGWPNDVEPADLMTPDQGQMGTYPQSQTGTD